MFVLSLAQSTTGSGPLHMSDKVREHFNEAKPLIFRAARNNPIKASFVAGIAWTESDFIPWAKNPTSGASGMMQIMPFHFGTYGLEDGKWRDPVRNLQAGVALLEKHGLGTEPIAYVLAGYGGFVTTDPNPYITKVLERAAFLLPEFVLYSFTPN